MLPAGFFSLIFANRIEPLTHTPDLSELKVEDGFRAHYKQHILPCVIAFEENRVQALDAFRRRMLIAMPVAAALVVAAILFCMTQKGEAAEGAITFSGVMVVFASAALWWWASKSIFAYKKDVKSKIFPCIFSYFGEDYVYKQDCPVSVDDLQPSKIIPYYEREETEDYVSGNYKGVGLELFEAELTKKVRSGKTQSTVTVFDGIFVAFTMNKDFKGKTIVQRDGGALGNWLGKSLGGLGGMQNVKLEDPVFEKQFEVYSTDQVEARYLLTPSFMERLLHLAATLKAKGICCSFYNDRVLFMISSQHDRFEGASIFKPATFFEDVENVLEEMRDIFAMIDMLKLNEKTGL